MAFTNIEAIQTLNLISVDLESLTFAMNYWIIISLGDWHSESPMIELTRLTSLQELWEQQEKEVPTCIQLNAVIILKSYCLIGCIRQYI